jgi:hypothetical protein
MSDVRKKLARDVSTIIEQCAHRDLIEDLTDGLIAMGWANPSDVEGLRKQARYDALMDAADAMEAVEYEDMRHVGCDPEYSRKGWADVSLERLFGASVLWAPFLRERAEAGDA